MEIIENGMNQAPRFVGGFFLKIIIHDVLIFFQNLKRDLLRLREDILFLRRLSAAAEVIFKETVKPLSLIHILLHLL